MRCFMVSDTGQDWFSYLAIVENMTDISNNVGKLNNFLPALLELSSYAIAPTDVPAHLKNTQSFTTVSLLFIPSKMWWCCCTCTAMSSGLLEAVSTATQRDRASISI